MSRNKALTVLQKTYDDSYLSCSTAVYHESQGNEVEAMRHWRGALDQIYEHNANKVPPTYAPRTDTEKALMEALKQLELQCKERIDLLEALRASRQDSPGLSSSSKLSKAPEHHDSNSRPRASIGQGTIPAVSYSDLSRPSLPHRPSLPNRPSGEAAVAGSSNNSHHPRVKNNTPAVATPKSHSPARPTEQNTPGRSHSPDKYTMRTTLRSGKPGDKPSKSSRKSSRPAGEGPSKAATLAWSTLTSREKAARGTTTPSDKPPLPTVSSQRHSSEQPRKASSQLQWDSHTRRLVPPPDPDAVQNSGDTSTLRHSDEHPPPSYLSVSAASSALTSSTQDPFTPQLSTPVSNRPDKNTNSRVGAPPVPSNKPPKDQLQRHDATAEDPANRSEMKQTSEKPFRRNQTSRPLVQGSQPTRVAPERANRSRPREQPGTPQATTTGSSDDDGDKLPATRSPHKAKGTRQSPESDSSNISDGSTEEETCSEDSAWKKKKETILKNLPPGVEESAAKQILNDIVVQGDEVRWGDIAGLEVAKNALREAVVYPFLRPDLFMGLREPARGMLLFGPPGTGKTMLARAVATESRSTFFSISASSLTSKFLGESEKLVRALFGLAKVLAPSIIFVDEIDSLLSQRSGSGEHEATRRIKTEFLIQWSDLQRAAAGRETTEKDKERGDANRVLVLAATNLPWAIDEAARRRFVRRQYIPLPEASTRETQLRTLLGQQKHGLSGGNISELVGLTEGFSGSDITALAKDAAMGPLRSLGDALLHMTMDDIRPITLFDFETSLGAIRPSVSKAGLKEYEDWAKEFGERGG